MHILARTRERNGLHVRADKKSDVCIISQTVNKPVMLQFMSTSAYTRFQNAAAVVGGIPMPSGHPLPASLSTVIIYG